MPWVRLDDSFADHPKIAEAGPLAAWLHTKALIYCGRHLTDGRIPKAVVVSLVDWTSVLMGNGVTNAHPDNLTLAAALVSVGLWHEDGAAFQIHDYLQYQPSRAEVLAEREKTKARVQRFRARNVVTSTVTNGVSNADGNAVVTLPPSRSHPDQKKQKKEKPATVAPADSQLSMEAKTLCEEYRAAWVASRRPEDGKPPNVSQGDWYQVRVLVKRFGVEEVRQLVQRYLDDPEPFLVRNGHALRYLGAKVDAYRARNVPQTRAQLGSKAMGPVAVGGIKKL